MRAVLDEVRFLAFDVFGTVVDWRSSIARAAEPFLTGHGIEVDPLVFADEWRSRYQPSMEAVRTGVRPWVPLERLNRESLETVLARHGVDFGAVTGDELAELNRAWTRLDPWPDSVVGLTRLQRRFPIGPLSNGSIAGMLALARFGGLPWNVILGAEIAHNYKPMPQTYLRSVEAVGLRPDQVAMVAAHNADLRAARAVGLRTVFVARPLEFGPGQTADLTAEDDWDLVTGSITEVADLLGC
ncbi:haloacid dehalogenase type II [Nakamurella leprariae]|uniref:Haloacid dehalogenase type II n=1 Tax=Nakamurella leprariae TaxID=2803911 RepID=A0A939C394_9ACTN|nr:haloacid dehalogenase type II [Nakamurella leprariae]MBM9469164.1 haloacid dehalogenase type II [Nakamurella leprariae]